MLMALYFVLAVAAIVLAIVFFADSRWGWGIGALSAGVASTLIWVGLKWSGKTENNKQ